MKRKCIYLLFTISMLMMVIPSFAQDKNRKSAPSSKSRVSVDNSLDRAQQLFQKDPDAAIDIVEKAILTAINQGDQDGERRAYEVLGDINFQSREYFLAFKNYEKAYQLLRKEKIVSTATYQLYGKLGKSAYYAKNYDAAKKYYQIYQQEAKRRRDKAAMLEAENALLDMEAESVVATEEPAADMALEETLVEEEAQGNKQRVAKISRNIGKKKEKAEPEVAIDYYQKSNQLSKEIGDEEGVNTTYDDLAGVYEQEQELDKAIEVKEEARRYNEEIQNEEEAAKKSVEIAELLLQKNESDKALEEITTNYGSFESKANLETRAKAEQIRSLAYDQQGDKEKALESFKRYQLLKDSIEQKKLAQAARGRKLENIYGSAEISKKEKELSETVIALQEEEIKRQRLLMYAMLALIIVLSITSFLIYRNAKAKRIANQLLTLKSLRSQMNPHFIFNALNSVNHYISINDERAANKYLNDFSRLMRSVMENSENDFIPLSREIEILELYLKLEHQRFQDKFDYTLDVDSSIDQEALLLPPMLIQPYIENAVWHGLRYKEEKGNLSVSIQSLGEGLEIKIEDNGIGREKSIALKTKNQKSNRSTGMRNINERVKLINDIYKAKLDVEVQNLDAAKKEGTAVKIKMNQKTFAKTVNNSHD